VASATANSPAQTGPYQVRVEGGPDLCWQAAGNGSPVTLAPCDSAVQGQQWTLTGDGVLMNGNGYCLEAGTGDRLFIGFDGQCSGAASGQQFVFRGGQLRRRAATDCAAPAGPLVAGTTIVTGACGRPRWSFGPGAAPGAAPKRVTPQVAAAPATKDSAKAGAADTAAAGPTTGQGDGELAVLLTAALLGFGGLLVAVGRRSRRPGRTGTSHRAGVLDHDGRHRLDVTEEARRRRGARPVMDARPTEPFDGSSIR
jgi:hypothetical protein